MPVSEDKMFCYLDDERDLIELKGRLVRLGYQVPPGEWTRCFWPEEVIKLLQTNEIEILSLDHDLGDAVRAHRDNRLERTGIDVLNWLEKQVFECGFKPPTHIFVHSMNPDGSRKMRQIVNRIQKKYKELNNG